MKPAIIQLLFIAFSCSYCLAEPITCVCDCVYSQTAKIRNHKYFESSGPSCSAIEGSACIGTHRGDTFRGTINNCESGPRESASGIANLTSFQSETADADTLLKPAAIRR